MITKEVLEELYLKQKLTSRSIAKQFGIDKTTVLRQLHKYGIPIDNEKRRFISKKVPLTREQKELIMGTMLGDGHIAKHGKYARLMISHCEKQKELTEYKAYRLNPLALPIVEAIDKRKNYKYYNFNTVTHHELDQIRSWYYTDSKKIVPDNIISWLTPLALSVWIMDDGTLNNRVNMRISTDSFSEKENYKLLEVLKILYDVNGKVCEYQRRGNKYYYLSFNKRNSIILSNVVRPYIIPCMKYKIIDCASTTTCETTPKSVDDIV